MGQPEDQPVHGNLLHPCPDEGYALPSKKETVIAVGQCPEDLLQTVLVLRMGWVGNFLVVLHFFSLTYPSRNLYEMPRARRAPSKHEKGVYVP